MERLGVERLGMERLGDLGHAVPVPVSALKLGVVAAVGGVSTWVELLTLDAVRSSILAALGIVGLVVLNLWRRPPAHPVKGFWEVVNHRFPDACLVAVFAPNAFNALKAVALTYLNALP